MGQAWQFGAGEHSSAGGGHIRLWNAGYGLEIMDNGTVFLTARIRPISSVQKVSDTVFHHVAVTKNGSKVVFYVDGVPDPPMT